MASSKESSVLVMVHRALNERPISRAELAQALGLSANAVGIALSKLRAKGLARNTGSSRWVITKPKRPQCSGQPMEVRASVKGQPHPRAAHCPHHSECLRFAVENDWRGMSCEVCSLYLAEGQS